MVEKIEKEYGRIPIELIEAGPELVRTRKVEENIDELAENIRRVGLIHPIRVYPKEGKYMLVAGQRRLMACKRLKWKEIPATIMSEPADPIDALKVSISENLPLLRRDLVREDEIDACDRLYMKYGTYKAVAETLGVKPGWVRERVAIKSLEEEAPKVAKEVKKKKRARAKGRWVDYGLKAVEAASCLTAPLTKKRR